MNPVEECWRQLALELNNRLFEDLQQMNREIRQGLSRISPPQISNYLFP